jgi:hypothetical protein
MNPIHEKIRNARKGHYIHCIEVNDVFELQNIIDCIFDEFSYEFEKSIIIDFFQTMQVYCLDPENENEVFDFDIENYINEL